MSRGSLWDFAQLEPARNGFAEVSNCTSLTTPSVDLRLIDLECDAFKISAALYQLGQAIDFFNGRSAGV